MPTTSAPLDVVLPEPTDPSFFPVGDLGDSNRGVQSDTAVLTTDGRVLYGWVETGGDPGSRVKIGYSPDIDTFLLQDNSVTFTQTIASSSSDAGRNRIGPVSITRNPFDGALYLAYNVTDTGDWTGIGSGETPPCSGAGDEGVGLILRSIDEGATWSFYSWIYCFGWPGSTSNFLLGPVQMGEIHFVDASTWIISGPSFRTRFGARTRRDANYVSTDGGLSWTRVAVRSAAVGAIDRTAGGSRNTMLHDGHYWWSATNDTGASSRYFVEASAPGDPGFSTLDGWDLISFEASPIGSSALLRNWTWAWIDSKDGLLYGTLGTGSGVAGGLQIVRWPTGTPSGGDPPFANDEYESLVTVASMPNGRSTSIVQQLGGCWLAVMNRGKVLGLPIEDTDLAPCIECQAGMEYDSDLAAWAVSREGLYSFSATLQVCRSGCEPAPPVVNC